MKMPVSFAVKKMRFSLPAVFLLFGIFVQNAFPQQKTAFFWDSVSVLSEKDSYFPLSVSDSSSSYVFFEKADKSRNEISISWIQKKNFYEWSPVSSLGDSFRYSGSEVPDMYSVAVSNNDVLAVSVLDSTSTTAVVKVYSSTDHASSFSSFAFPVQEKQVTSSRIFASSSGGFVLFVSLGEGKQSPTESSFSILYSESSDGKKWSSLVPFKSAEMISNAFSPYLAQVDGKDMVVFEGWYEKNSTTSQIYSSIKTGSTWSVPVVVTDDNSVIEFESEKLDEDELIKNQPLFLRYKNFRPMVLSSGGDTKITWERSSKNGGTATVMVAPLGADGKITDKNDVESLNKFGNGRRPSMFLYNGSFFIQWFDNRDGNNKVHLCEYLGVQWVEIDSVLLRQNKSIDTAFASPLVTKSPKNTDSLSLVWQQEKSGRTQIAVLAEDYHADPPLIQPKNFRAGRHNANTHPEVKVVMPDDVSEIAGCSSIWTVFEEEEPPLDEFSPQFKPVRSSMTSTHSFTDIKGDKKVYFKAAVLDKAGNWSKTQVVEYYLDQTPPEKLDRIFFDTDEYGFALSNDVAFSWDGTTFADDVAGYSWTLTKIAPIEKQFEVTKNKKIAYSVQETQDFLAEALEKNAKSFSKAKKPSSRILGTRKSVSFRNRDNGLYVFSVCVIDEVGNVSAPYSVPLFMNKYKASTLIKNVTASRDDYGAVSLSITGQEFLYDGTISEVIVKNTVTGKTYRFENEKNYAVETLSSTADRIGGIKIDYIEQGVYSVQIRHSTRGLTTWKKNLVLGEGGTVKYEKQYNFEPYWKINHVVSDKYSIDSEKIVFWSVIVLILFGMTVCLRGIFVGAAEVIAIRNGVKHMLQGDYMSEEKIERLHSALKVRVSLKAKFALSITTLLVLIVLGVTFAIGTRLMNIQERILISGLKDRVKVVMGNMASGIQTYLDDGRDKIVEIGAIVNQTDNFAEAKSATILSYHIDGKKLNDGSRPLDYVWASNDENILRKIDAPEFDAGTVRFDHINENYLVLCDELNRGARRSIDELPRASLDNPNIIFNRLNEYSATHYSSFPLLEDGVLDRNVPEYYFYWPVFYQKSGDTQNYLQAMIFLEVSTDTLIRQIDTSRRVITLIGFIAVLVATVFAIISAFMFSSIIVSPIRKIVDHVKKITETENKLLLEGVEIKITSRDELRTLGDSVNDMTKGLVQGAKNEERAKIAYQRAAKEREAAARARAETAELNIMNLDGQAVQKAFIPLVSDGTEKETTASFKDKALEIFGYYEGTDAVSGDYFDYKKLDDRWYAFIKCDASGHGVPAALIMTIVATIFRRYFSLWKFEKNGVKLNLLASDINDFIESLGIKGKFAAMMICLFDSKTGDVYTCNAGDNILRIFDSVERKINVLTMHETPAAGPLPSFMVEMKGGYKVEKIKLKPGDVLLLYTDGIEESTRFYRNAECEIEEHDGVKSEQMEPYRVQAVIEAVLNRKKYVLNRSYAPLSDETLEFDFTKCEGSIEEAIIALTAVEKVFRMYKKQNSTGAVEKSEMLRDGKKQVITQIVGDGIKIDRKIDAFLQKYFNRYDYYCVNRVDKGETNYLYYTGVNEDVQADDLTLLAIKKM